MTESGLSGAEGSAAGTDADPKPADPNAAPADGSGEVTSDVGFDSELGLVPESGEVDAGEADGTDGFEEYDKTDEGDVVADDELAAREVDEAPTDDESAEVKPDEEAAPEPEPEVAEPEPEVTPEKFMFGGEEFESQAAAEQNFKSLRGQFKPLQEKLAATEAANQGWNDAYQQGKLTPPQPDRAEPEGSASVKPGDATPEPGSDDAIADIIKAVDWQTVEDIHEKDGPIAAQQWALYQALKQHDKAVSGRLKEGTEDFQKFQEVQRVNQLGVDTFQEAARRVDGDGNPVYPELKDQEAASEILNIWNRLALPDDYKYSPAGVYVATLAYRDTMGRLGLKAGETPASTPPAEAPVDPVVASVVAAAAANQDVVPGSDRTIPAKPGQSPGEQAAQAILKAGLGTDPELGLTP